MPNNCKPRCPCMKCTINCKPNCNCGCISKNKSRNPGPERYPIMHDCLQFPNRPPELIHVGIRRSDYSTRGSGDGSSSRNCIPPCKCMKCIRNCKSNCNCGCLPKKRNPPRQEYRSNSGNCIPPCKCMKCIRNCKPNCNCGCLPKKRSPPRSEYSSYSGNCIPPCKCMKCMRNCKPNGNCGCLRKKRSPPRSEYSSNSGNCIPPCKCMKCIRNCKPNCNCGCLKKCCGGSGYREKSRALKGVDDRRNFCGRCMHCETIKDSNLYY